MSSDEEVGPIRGSNSARRQRLFSDDEDEDDRPRSRVSDVDDDGPAARKDDNDGRPGGGDRDTDEEEEEERKKEERKKKDEAKKKNPKGPVRRQMISEDMLIGKDGMSKLPQLFENFKFGGKGHEKEDLNHILAKLEHWIHLLHPKQPFDQCLQRIEFLGLKRKVVKVHLKKIRMGMVNNYEADDNPIVDMEDDEALPGEMNVDNALTESAPMEVEVEPTQAIEPGTSTGMSRQATPANDFPDDDGFPDFDEIDDLMQQTPVYK